LDTDEANIVDAAAFNWRLVVYPLLVVLIVVVGGLGYYYNAQYQRDQLEDAARSTLVPAKTPEELIKVADQYPTTTQATLALNKAANISFDKHDYTAAIADFQKIAQNSAVDPALRDSAQLGAAASLEATGKTDDAINAYLDVARRGAKSAYAPFAYTAAARLYEEKGDKDNERRVLSEASSLDPDSPFVKQAQAKLNEISGAGKQPPSASVPTTISTAPATATAPVATPAAAPASPK
jgi:predicted negative regulator of RcsB-dependent stress response